MSHRGEDEDKRSPNCFDESHNRSAFISGVRVCYTPPVDRSQLYSYTPKLCRTGADKDREAGAHHTGFKITALPPRVFQDPF